MFELLPAEMQIYLFVVGVGLTAPWLVYWLLSRPLDVFLTAIFADVGIVRFWQRVVVLTMVGSSLSAAVAYRPDMSIANDTVAMVFSLADQVQEVLLALLWAMLALFLPLLLCYTVLFAGRGKPSSAANAELSRSESRHAATSAAAANDTQGKHPTEE